MFDVIMNEYKNKLIITIVISQKKKKRIVEFLFTEFNRTTRNLNCSVNYDQMA